MIKQIFSKRYVRIVLLALLGLALFGLGVLLRPAPEATAAPEFAQAADSLFQCIPLQVATFPSRVHLRCSNTPGEGIYYWAASSVDSATASRYLSMFTSALLTGKQMLFFYNPLARGDAWGCGSGDCRPITGAVLLP